MRNGIFLLMTIFMATANLAAADTVPTLRVMSFNVRMSAAQDGENAWPLRRDFLVETIKKFGPDLLGLQEVLPDQSEFIQAQLPDLQLVGKGREEGKNPGEASPILFRKSRFELLDSGQFWLSETPEVVGSKGWDAAYPRICTYVKLRDKLTHLTFLYFNTHWDHKGVVARNESSKLMRDRVVKLGGQAPVIITGDFNSYEDTEAYRTLLGTGSTGIQLIDSYRETHPQPQTDEASFHAFKGIVQGKRIDWILHSPEFQARAAQIDHTSKDSHYPSDHYPVTAELILK